MRSALTVAAMLASTAIAGAAGSWTPPSPGAVYRSMGVLYAAPVQAVAFVGVGDVMGASGATYWHSCSRAYTAAYAAGGGNACDLRRADAATCTVKFAANGFADVAVGTPCAGATVTAFCGASPPCVVTKLYDHTAGGHCGGTCDIIKAASATEPTYTLSCVGSLPCLTFAGNEGLRLASGSITIAQPYTLTTVQKVTGSFTSAQYLFYMDGPGPGFSFNITGANDNTWYTGGGLPQAAADNVWHAAVVTSDTSSSSTHYLDGNAPNTGNLGVPSQGDVIVGSGPITATSAATYFESGGWSSSLGATVSAAVIANQHGPSGCNC